MSVHPNVVDTSKARGVLRVEAEVAVVGSGAGGAVSAKELAEAGISVALLEEGAYYQAADFNQREADMYRRLYRDQGAQATRDLSINVLQGRAVGGSTVINNCICFRTPEPVLSRWREEFGLANLSSESLRPYFERVERTLGVVPIVSVEVNENNSVLLQGCERLGYRAGTFAHNRRDCVGCGYCMLGCSYERHRGVDMNYVPHALDAGCRLYTRCRVEEILVEGGKLVGVAGSVLDQDSRRPRAQIVVRAPVVVLAAGAIHTPALLLANRLANTSGQMGRNLALHPIAPSFATFDRVIDGFIGIPQSAYCDEFERLEDGSNGFLIEGIFAMPALFASVCPSFGEEHLAIMKDYRHLSGMYAMAQDEGRGTVGLADDRRPLIDYHLGERGKEVIRRGLKEVARIFFAAGAQSVITLRSSLQVLCRPDEIERLDELSLRPNEIALFSAHPQGSCRMHADPREGPIDGHGESHDIPNLFVADASAFPTSVGVNPQITIMTLATRQASEIRRRLGRPPLA
jgi:choline dehydrogenase-like flavoprotein